MSKPKLKRSLTLSQLVFYGVGTILGLGIYVLLGKIGGEAGTLAPAAFLVAALIASFSALSYGELAARIPESAGEVKYVDRAFNLRWLSILIGWLIVISATISTATMVNGYVGYIQVFFDIPGWLIITMLVLSLGAISIKGIGESMTTIMVITVIEVIGILMVIVLAGDNLMALPDRWTEFVPEANLADWRLIFSGAFLAFFAFIGFEDMVNVAEEAKDPTRDIQRAIIVSMVVMTILYTIVALIGSLGLTPEQLEASTAPMADILAQKGDHYPKIISAIGLVAIINGVLVQIVMGSRVLYGMAENRMAPHVFGIVSEATRTPIWASIFMTGGILILALSFDLRTLAEATNFVLLFVFSMVNLSLWRLKQKEAPPRDTHPVPMVVPILGTLLSFGLLLWKVLDGVW